MHFISFFSCTTLKSSRNALCVNALIFFSCHLLRKSLHTLLKRQRLILHCYHTSGAKFVPSRLCLVTETAWPTPKANFYFRGPRLFLIGGPSGRFATTGVIQISIKSARYFHWTSCSNSWTYCFILNYPDIMSGTNCAANKLRGTFHKCSPAGKTLYFVPIACQGMLVNCGANTRRPVWSAYVLHMTMPIELCITQPTQKW